MSHYYNLNSKLICNKNESLSKVLALLKITKGYPLIVINDDKSLYGVISNGDISKFFNSRNSIDTNNIRAKDIANPNPKVAHILDKYETIEGYLSNTKVRTIPIIDHNRVVKRIVTAEKPYLKIGNRNIGEGYEPYLIAEIGVNHNGDLKEAKYLIKKAAECNCNAVKFQHRSENLYNESDIDSCDLGTQYIIAELKRTRLNIKELKECTIFAKENNLDVIITAFDIPALKEITSEDIDLAALKIASCDLTNQPLFYACGELELPLIISTGMSFEREISEASLLAKSLMIEHAFLHCNATYPAPPEDINLSYIRRLKEITRTVVGYSSHDGNIQVPICSIGYGADILEFHITRSNQAKGTDHRASVEINKLKELVEGCGLAYKTKGNENPRTPSQGETINRNSLGKSYALNRNYKAGEFVENKDLILISPGSGFTIDQKEKIIGKKLLLNKNQGSIINPQDLEIELSFNKKLLDLAIKNLLSLGYLPGIPVRYHDVERLKEIFNVPLLEFHMSDRDLNLSPSNFLNNNYKDIDLIVHSVEQFEDGFIFDLCSQDEEVINRSFEEIKKLTLHIDELRTYFKYAKKVPIVINLGGFTNDNFLEENCYLNKLNICTKNLNKLIAKYNNYEFLPQTMPPFPWHQGGRSFHNILTSIKKIEDFIKKTESNVCFDVSHSFMSCNYFNENLFDHLNILSSRVKHIHLADAESSNSEGLEIGEGSIDFINFHNSLNKKNLKIKMIPEIWQGHLNNGAKFANSIIRFSEKLSEINQ